MDGLLYMVHTLEALRLGIIACVTAVYVRYVCQVCILVYTIVYAQGQIDRQRGAVLHNFLGNERSPSTITYYMVSVAR